MMKRRRKTNANSPQSPRARRQRRRLGLFAAQFAVCILAIGAFLYLFALYVQQSGLFNVKIIRIDGADFLLEEDIIAHAGVTSGDCIFLVRSEAVRQRILAMPFVRACRVERVFPDRLEINVRERVALATLMVNNRLYELDQDCTILRELETEEPHVGPFLTVETDLDHVEIGMQISRDDLINAMNVWRAFTRTSMARDVTVSEIFAEERNKITMTCNELNCEIRWGRDGIESQAWKLDSFWESEKGRMPFREYIDLRFGNDVACR